MQSIQAGSRTLISHSYSTDGNHQLTRSDYGNGDSVSYGYDSLGRTTSVRYEDGAQVDYTYDNNGNLGLLTDSASGRKTQYFYDFQDRLMRWEQSGSGYANSVTWGYDDNNNLSTQKQTLNGTTYTTSYTYDKDNRLTKTTEGTVSAGYTYDALGRMTAMDAQSGGKSVVKTTIGYNDPSSTTATGQVRTWKSGATTYTYAYDARGNITSVSDGQNITTYAYDSFDQLVRENNQAAGKTWTYAYDSGGNILSKTEYAYTTGSLGTAVRTIPYGYGDASWSDLLTSIGGQSLTADEIGNLLSDGTWTYTWQHGRQLAGMSKAGQTIAYGYDSDGKRIAKTVNGTTYNYHYLGDQLVELTWDGNKLHFTYDSTGPLSVNYNGTEYFYVKNAQGDVTGLVSTSGARVVTYTYDAWGNPLSTTGSLATTLGEQNPLRYRGYVYDTETGLYYLQSRYYNPGWSRFINVDSQLNCSMDIGGCNAFAYCLNNPVNMADIDGHVPKWLSGALTVVSGITQAISGAALISVMGFTGIGALVGGALLANGAATIASGIGMFSNDLFGTNIPEENILRTAARKVGRAIGGERGEKVGAAAYDTANFLATAYSIGGGVKEVLSLTSKTLGAEAKITKLAAPIFRPSVFTDMYKIERAMSPLVECKPLPKTWVNVVNGIGSFTDLVLTTIGTIDLFGGKE